MVPPCVAFGASPRRGATPAARQSRFHGVLGFMHLLALVIGLLLSASLPAVAQTAAGASHGLGPLVTKARGGQCVDDPVFMRRNHMALLKHQRDDTVHGGVRSGKYSLKACVACHASEASQSVSAEAGDFCQSCHSFAAVKIDCFGCHASKPPAAGAHAAAHIGTGGL